MGEKRKGRLGGKKRSRDEPMQTQREAGVRSSDESSAGLDNYRRVCEKYQALAEKFEEVTRQKTAVYQLGFWALRTSESGLTLVRKGAIELSNDRWHELARGEDGNRAWEAVAVAEQTPLVHESLRELALYEAREVLARPAPAWRLTRYSRRGGGQVLEVRTERVDPEQELVALLAHDVTEQARSETELRRAQDALLHRDRLQTIGEVASGVAHDLNNALNVMRLRLELFRRAGSDARMQREHLDAFARIVDDAAVRVARMHDLSGKRGEEFETVDLGQVISDAVSLARTDLEQSATAGRGRFHLVTSTREASPVHANPAELRHLFVNLLLNARDAMPGGGTITIDCHPENGGTTVSVLDEGTGIPEENLERIFDSFFTTKGTRGTGLGLSMARGAMARVGGSIRAHNRTPRGAEFVLRFPLDTAARARPLPADPSPAAAPAGTLRVLLVDDDRDCLEVTREVLRGEAFAIEVAASGAEALALLREHRFDVLLCDVGMPEMSGWQVAAEARAELPSLAIYMITGWASDFASADPRHSAVDGVLGKPIDLDELRKVIRGIPLRPEDATGTLVPAAGRSA